MTSKELHATHPTFVDKHFEPPDIKITLEKSDNPCISKTPLPVFPIQPKSCAQSINKNASCFKVNFYNATRSV